MKNFGIRHNTVDSYSLILPRVKVNMTAIRWCLITTVVLLMSSFMATETINDDTIHGITIVELAYTSPNVSRPESLEEYKKQREKIKQQSNAVANKVVQSSASLQGVKFKEFDAPGGYIRQDNAKSVMGAHCLGSGTKNWKMMQGPDGSVADADHGCLQMVDGRYCVAVGSHFVYNPGVAPVGQYLDVILEDGTIIPCISGDWKADQHTNASRNEQCNAEPHSYHSVDHSVVEFIAGTDKATGYDGWKAKLKTPNWWSINDVVPEWKSPVAKIIVYDKVYELPNNTN